MGWEGNTRRHVTTLALLCNRTPTCPDQSMTGAPSQTGEMSPHRLYGKTKPRGVSFAESNEGGVPTYLLSPIGQHAPRIVTFPSHLGFITGEALSLMI